MRANVIRINRLLRRMLRMRQFSAISLIFPRK